MERTRSGLVDTDLGCGVITRHIARKSGGRSDGYYMIVLFRLRELAFFIYGFS